MIKHGYAVRIKRPKIYGVWASMIQRCHNPNDKKFKHYGARGISVCIRWRRFENFLEDMGIPKSGMTLGRKNSAGNYEPNNCEWQTYTEQNRNTSRNRIITVRGITGPVSQLAEIFHVNLELVRSRLKWGWGPESAFFTPVDKRFTKHRRVPASPSR